MNDSRYSQTSMFKPLVDKRRLTEGETVSSRGNRETISLWSALDDFRAGQLLLPPHQRELAWSDAQQADYVTTICSDATPPGCFEVYQLKREDGRLSAKYLNDGSQRLRTARDLLENPESYGISRCDAEYILRNTTYPLTLKTHQNHQEALRRFQIVNNNLPLTPYQMAIGDVVYCEGDEKHDHWQKFVTELHERIGRVIARTATRGYPSRSTKNYLPNLHRLYRHDLSMFLRYISAEKGMIDYRPGAKGELGRLMGDKHIERRLGRELGTYSIADSRARMEEFFRTLELETAMVEDAWNRVRESPGRGIDHVVVRWLWDVAIWRRNNKYRVAPWQKFLREFLDVSGGRPTIIAEDVSTSSRRKKGDKRISITISRVAQIREVCDVLQLSFLDEVNTKRKRQEQLKRGWQVSHIEPFAVYGEGPTFDEPGSPNMGRGAETFEGEDDGSDA